MDETGVHDEAAVTAVAGYFAHPKRWRKFDRRWYRTLDSFGLKHFHMAEYAHSRGQFQEWSEGKRLALAKELLPLVPEYTRWGVAVAMVKVEFDEGLKDFPKARAALGHPYGCCFHWFISLVMGSVSERFTEARLEIIHEDNDYKNDAMGIWMALRDGDLHRQLRSLTFASKAAFAGLQAADVLAYEAQKRLAEPNRPERKSLATLRNRENVTIQYIKRDWLQANGQRLEGLVDAGAAVLA